MEGSVWISETGLVLNLSPWLTVCLSQPHTLQPLPPYLSTGLSLLIC
jgi:hypothetical protein